MPLTIGTRLGAYEILAPLGAGGMGEVYRARDTRLRREVAVKVLPADVSKDPDRLARFEREARAVAALNHPNIVVLHNIEDAAGMRFLIMELVEGVNLDTHLEPNGLALERVLEIGIVVADALAAAHERGVIHRDLKPPNVMITREGRVKILDFGLAKLAAPAQDSNISVGTTLAMPDASAGDIVGTLPYMAPEQIRGEAVDARTDLFALGVLLYELATGRRPFGGRTSADIASAILRDPPEPITRARADLPAELDRIVRRCLEKNPRERFQAALDVANDLRGLRGEPQHPPTDRASIAVLPFDNLSGDPDQEYFADGMVEEIITGLSRIKWLFVTSRSSSFIYKGKPVDVRAVGRALGVRYVLQGSVRRSGQHVRVSGQLIETATAAHVWADRYDGTLGDIFELQDEMTMSVVGAVEPTLRKAEIERVRRKRPDSMDAYDLLLRALPFAMAAMPEDAEKAIEILQQALRLEPDYSAVHGFLAWCHEQRYLRGGLHADVRQAALFHAHSAIATGTDDAMALAMGGFVIGILERDYEMAIEAFDRAVALSPSSAVAFSFSSIIRALSGSDATAIDHGKMGLRLSPHDPLVTRLSNVGLAYAYFFTGRFTEAASAASRASAASPRFSVPRYLHAAALVRLGRLDEAKAIASVLMSLQPGFTITGLVSGNITTPERMRALTEALQEAGLPA